MVRIHVLFDPCDFHRHRLSNGPGCNDKERSRNLELPCRLWAVRHADWPGRQMENFHYYVDYVFALARSEKK
jgi:hypothetical protein